MRDLLTKKEEESGDIVEYWRFIQMEEGGGEGGGTAVSVVYDSNKLP